MRAKPTNTIICWGEDCLNVADYEFNDIQVTKHKGEIGKIIKPIHTVILGYSCQECFDEVKISLEENHDTEYET